MPLTELFVAIMAWIRTHLLSKVIFLTIWGVRQVFHSTREAGMKDIVNEDVGPPECEKTGANDGDQ